MGRYSKSSTLLQTILFIIIAGIISVTIYYVYQSNRSTSESLKNIENSNVTIKKATAQTQTQAAAPALNFVQ
jgi:hypothetical protein